MYNFFTLFATLWFLMCWQPTASSDESPILRNTVPKMINRKAWPATHPACQGLLDKRENQEDGWDNWYQDVAKNCHERLLDIRDNKEKNVSGAYVAVLAYFALHAGYRHDENGLFAELTEKEAIDQIQFLDAHVRKLRWETCEREDKVWDGTITPQGIPILQRNPALGPNLEAKAAREQLWINQKRAQKRAYWFRTEYKRILVSQGFSAAEQAAEEFCRKLDASYTNYAREEMVKKAAEEASEH